MGFNCAISDVCLIVCEQYLTLYDFMSRHENSTIHINFTEGENNLERPVHQIFKVYIIFFKKERNE